MAKSCGIHCPDAEMQVLSVPESILGFFSDQVNFLNLFMVRCHWVLHNKCTKVLLNLVIVFFLIATNRNN